MAFPGSSRKYYVFPEKRFENAFPGNLRFCANCFAQNTYKATLPVLMKPGSSSSM
jgi:hypothetical protein